MNYKYNKKIKLYASIFHVEISFLIECGKGLEDLARQELVEKGLPEKNIMESIENKGYISVHLDEPTSTLDSIFSVFHQLRCFENIYLIINKRSSRSKQIHRASREIEIDLRHFLEETFEFFLQRDFQNLIKTICRKNDKDSKLIEIIAPVSHNLRNLGLNQRIIQGIAKKVILHHGLKSVHHHKHALQIKISDLLEQFIAMIRLPYPAGNLPLKHIHPTGLYPNYAFGLLFKAIQSYKSKKFQDERVFTIIDPMMGVAAIPILTSLEEGLIFRLLNLKNHNLNLWGYELLPDIFSSAQHNIDEFHLQKKIQIKNIDFNKDLSDLKANLIITQPPYGLSIKMTEKELNILYLDFFNWASNHALKITQIALVTPHKSMIERLQTKIKWELINFTPIKEHSLNVFFLILQQKPD